MTETITSAKNLKVKDALELMERRYRDKTGLMLIEGLIEIGLAAKNGIEFTRLFYCEELFRGAEERRILDMALKQGAELVPVNAYVFQKMVYREDSFGIFAIARQPSRTLDDIPLGTPPFLVVVEGVEKPGNLGAILRSSDAAGVDGVIVCGKSTDIYNPNVVRASIGTIFTVPVVEEDASTAASWLKEKGIKAVAATPHTTLEYFDADLKGSIAIVMGSEHEGLSDVWLKESEIRVRIPMKGEADSLNLSVSTALLLYEAVRQRRS